MDLVLIITVIAACILGSFLGALMGVQMTDRYYQRQSDNKLYGTVFSGPPEPPEPIGDRLLSSEEYEELMAQQYEEQFNQDCDSPEPQKTTDVGWPPQPHRETPPPDKENKTGGTQTGWPPPAPPVSEFSGWRDNFEAGIHNPKESKPLPGSLGSGR